LDRLQRFLIGAALARRPVTYGALLRACGFRVGPRNVAALCRDLGRVQARLAAIGAPDLACLVVRAADGLPGVGWFAAERAEGAYAGPAAGLAALAYLRACQERAYAWAATAVISADAEPLARAALAEDGPSLVPLPDCVRAPGGRRCTARSRRSSRSP
jgi:hypothetical protein